MTELRGRYSNTDPLPLLPCVYCRIPTDVRVEVPRGDGAELPLHVLCAAVVIRLYARMRGGDPLLSRRDRERVRLIESNIAALPPGGAT